MNETQARVLENATCTVNNNLAMYGLYSVYDKKSQIYSPVQMFRNNAEAIRFFTDFMQDKTSIVSKHPLDFCIYKVGYLDIKTGDIEKTLNNHAEFILECEDLNG